MSRRYLLFLQPRQLRLYAKEGRVLAADTAAHGEKNWPAIDRGRAKLVVVLSNAFCDFMLAPWSAAIHRPKDLQNYAASLLADSGGASPVAADIRASRQDYQSPFIIALLQKNTLSTVRQIAAALLPRGEIVSIQPLLSFLWRYEPPADGGLICAEGGKVLSALGDKKNIVDIESVFGGDFATVQELANRQKLRAGQHPKNTVLYLDDTQPPPMLPPSWSCRSLNRLPWCNIGRRNGALELDYQPAAVSFWPLAAAVLLLSTALFSNSVNTAAIKNKKSRLAAIAARHSQNATPSPTEKLWRENWTTLNQQLPQKKLAWDNLFSVLESLNYEDVALLSVRSGDGQTLEIHAEARDLEKANFYLGELQKKTPLSDVEMISHTTQIGDVYTPVQFVIKAKWR